MVDGRLYVLANLLVLVVVGFVLVGFGKDKGDDSLGKFGWANVLLEPESGFVIAFSLEEVDLKVCVES